MSRHILFHSKKLLVLLMAISVGWGVYFYFSAANSAKIPVSNNGQNSQTNFINFILQRSELSNQEILAQRAQLLVLHERYLASKRIDLRNRHWLNNLANKYRLEDADFTNPDTWLQLNKRVDIVPNSLVIAQAIEESGWGRSRFAEEGNNYFGMWCYGEDCDGIVPAQRQDGQDYALQTFPSALASVEDYMNNLNTHFSYVYFRDLRHQLRKEKNHITGLELVPALVYYSNRREQYVDTIATIIRSYHLSQFDVAPTDTNNLALTQNISEQLGFPMVSFVPASDTDEMI